MDALDNEWQGLLPASQWTRRGFVMSSLVTGFALSVQPVSAQTITTDTNGLDAGEVKVPVPDGSIPAYRAMPAQGGPFPTVLVIHEAWGVHEHIKDLCRRFAKLGYFAIAPELWARQGNAGAAKDMDETRKIMSSVPEPEVMSDLDATAAYAKSTGKADLSRLAVTGFCWGGRQTWLYAAHNAGLKAAVSWYGVDRPVGELTPKNPVDVIPDLKCPMLALYGGEDKSIPPELIEKRQAACKAADKTCEFKVYAGAQHGFNADYRPSYNAEAAKDGWARMLAWFKEHGVG
jgi:carboxymethylenebutenolidase